MEKPNILAAAAAEEAELLAQLGELERDYQRRRAPLLRKLDATRAVKSAFGAQPELHFNASSVSITPSGGSIVATAIAATAAMNDRPKSHKATVIEAAEALLASGVPMKTALLREQMEARGVTFNAANPEANLSVILSKDPRFVSDRRTGWSLAQKNPQDAATSAGSLPT